MMLAPLNLASTDLNLLVAFDALMTERSVTRAGQRIGVGQPGMSAVLARLRDTFRDELFVRIPGKPMKPTKRAIELHGQVSEILAGVSRVFSAERTFDPATARASILIATGDPAGTLVAPRLLKLLSTKAPRINIRLLALDKRDAFDRLDRGDIDLVFASFANVPKRIRRERLFTDTYVCVARREHARRGTRRAIDLDDELRFGIQTPQFGLEGLSFRLLAAGDNQPGSLLCEVDCGGPADAGQGASDQDNGCAQGPVLQDMPRRCRPRAFSCRRKRQIPERNLS